MSRRAPYPLLPWPQVVLAKFTPFESAVTECEQLAWLEVFDRVLAQCSGKEQAHE